MEIQAAKKFSSFNEVLDFAIEREKEAYVFYQNLANIAKRPEVIKAIRRFAEEEKDHRSKLEAIKAGKSAISFKDIGNLRIADYVPDVDEGPDMSYVELLMLAMRKEKLSYRLYADLAELAESEDLRELFLKLAQEEAAHKLRFEFEYDLEIF